MKKKVLLLALALVLAITGVVTGKANSHFFAGVRYTDTAFPGACLYPATLPSNCAPLPQSPTVICTTVAGSTLKYYQGTTCVNPYYRIP